MSNAGLDLYTTMNVMEVADALEYGQRNLDHATYAKVTKACKQLVLHSLLWIFIGIIVGFGIMVAGHQVMEMKSNELLNAYDATNWVPGVRIDSNTVQYTKGESYRYDVTELGIDLDRDFPNQRRMDLLLDDNNQLKGVVSDKDSKKITDIYAFGIVYGLVAMVVIIVGFILIVRKHTSYGRKWYAFLKWCSTRNDTLLDIIRE